MIDAGRGVSEALVYLQRIEQQHSPAISAVTQMELMVGCRNKSELQALEEFLARYRVLKLDEQISDIAIELLHRYQLSHGLLIADALIAATALSMEESFVTKNQRHYRFIEELDLLDYP